MAEQSIKDLIEGVEPAPGTSTDVDAPPVSRPWWRARTARRPISDYREHPLRPVSGDGWTRLIRGAEGLLGELDLAVVDIGVGLVGIIYELAKADKVGPAAKESEGEKKDESGL